MANLRGSERRSGGETKQGRSLHLECTVAFEVVKALAVTFRYRSNLAAGIVSLPSNRTEPPFPENSEPGGAPSVQKRLSIFLAEKWPRPSCWSFFVISGPTSLRSI